MLTRSQGWKTSLCECITSHKTLHRPCEEHRENRTSATQGYLGTCLKENGISFQLKVSVGLCHPISIFFFAYLLRTGNSQVNIWISLGRRYRGSFSSIYWQDGEDWERISRNTQTSSYCPKSFPKVISQIQRKALHFYWLPLPCCNASCPQDNEMPVLPTLLL